MKELVIRNDHRLHVFRCRFGFDNGLSSHNGTLNGPDLSSMGVGINSEHYKLLMFTKDTFWGSRRKRGTPLWLL